MATALAEPHHSAGAFLLEHRYPFRVHPHTSTQNQATETMDTTLREKAFSNDIEAKIEGPFEPKEIRAQARAFALLTGCTSALDGEATVKVFIRGAWETADGHYVHLDSDTIVDKIGTKYLHVHLRGPDGMEPTRVVPDWDEDFPPRAFIREGSITEHTENVGPVN